MLYNPNWTETKPDVFSLDALIAWLEKQPAKITYDWNSIENCLVAKYLKAATGETFPAREWRFLTVFGEDWPYYEVSETAPHTFGAALQRAKAYRDGQ